MIPTMILFGLVVGRRLRPLPSRHRRLSAGRRPGHPAVDGVRHRQAFHALRADRKAEIPANLPLPPAADSIRSELLATRTCRSPGRTVVRRAHPCRARGDASARRRTAGCCAPNWSFNTRPHDAAPNLTVGRQVVPQEEGE